MPAPPGATLSRAREWWTEHWSHAQHRNAYFLMLNTVTGAAAGLVFWLVMARIAGLPPSEIGVGYAIVAIGTTIGVIAKGGLDTALLRTVPGASRREGARLLRFAIAIGAAAALLLSLGLWTASHMGKVFTDSAATSVATVAAIGVLLVVTWLQDAYFLAEGDARFSFQRNLVFSAARLLLPLPIIALALPRPVALTWALALLASAVAAAVFARRVPRREGREVPRREFLRSAARNVTGSASEFLPGLLLVPLVLAVDGAAAAAYFGIAWTAASLLFLGSAAISRSTLAEMVRNGAHTQAQAIRRAAKQLAWLIGPAALLGALVGPYVLAIFGRAYAQEGGFTFAILCVSALFVAPYYLYLAVLRADERPIGLIVLPAAMVALLFLLAPLFETRLGLAGVAAAWLVANAPFGLWGAYRLRLEAQEVKPHDAHTPSVGGRPHPE